MKQNPFNNYKKTQVMTASREKILVLMYAGAIKFLKQATEAGNRGEVQERSRLIGRTQDIISELRSTLNFKASQELASELDRLYIFISESLLKAMQSMETEHIDNSLKILITLNEAWEGVASNLSRPNVANQEEK